MSAVLPLAPLPPVLPDSFTIEVSDLDIALVGRQDLARAMKSLEETCAEARRRGYEWIAFEDVRNRCRVFQFRKP